MDDGQTQMDALRARIAGLDSPAEVTSGHCDLAPGLWLSTDPEGQGHLAVQPGEDRLSLSLSEGDSGAWACLGMLLPLDELKRARFLGLLAALDRGDLVSMQPTLRYFHGDRAQDVPAAPLLLSPGRGESLAHIPLDAGLLDSASGCELNLFFHTNRFEAEFTRLEPVLIL